MKQAIPTDLWPLRENKDYKLYINKFDNLEVMGQFLKNQK